MPVVELTDSSLPQLPPRAADSHKGTYGKVLIVAGSRGLSGAAVLCGSAALRSGAGLVEVATPADVQPVVAAGNPCYTTSCLPIEVKHHGWADDVAPIVLELAASANVLSLGPGVGKAGRIAEIVEIILVQATLPIVLDADGINALNADVLKRRTSPTVLTPHPGEFARLLKCSTEEVQQNRAELAVNFAAQYGVIVVLKGHGTLVTDGQKLYRNNTGNPGMATGGTGDVLTGVVAALIAQGLSPFSAAQLGVHVHGKAGDIAAEQVGQIALIATDLIDYLPAAFASTT
jgi:NAD(P)H-hydrate epimerase